MCVWLGVIFSRVDGLHVGGTYVALSRLAPALVRTENHSRSVRAGLVSRTQGGASYGVHDSRYSPFARSLSRNETENDPAQSSSPKAQRDKPKIDPNICALALTIPSQGT